MNFSSSAKSPHPNQWMAGLNNTGNFNVPNGGNGGYLVDANTAQPWQWATGQSNSNFYTNVDPVPSSTSLDQLPYQNFVNSYASNKAPSMMSALVSAAAQNSANWSPPCSSSFNSFYPGSVSDQSFLSEKQTTPPTGNIFP